MVTVTLQSKATTADGKIILLWSDGYGQEFASQADYQSYFIAAENTDNARQFCLAYGEARNPNLMSILNKNFILDLAANQPIKVQ